MEETRTKSELKGKILCQAGFEALQKRNEEAKQRWLNISSDGKMICRTCNKEKDLSLFSKRQSEPYEQWQTECRECENIRQRAADHKRKIKGGFEREIKEIYRGMINNCKKRNIEIKISIEYMLDLYKKQEGKCYYTKRQMSVEPNSLTKMSLDRIDSNKNYEEGNVVWCIWSANNMKQDLTIPDCIKIMSEMIVGMKEHCEKNNILY